MFVLSDATNGYMYQLQIYTGKELDTTVDAGLCSQVVLELMTGLEYKGLRLYMNIAVQNCFSNYTMTWVSTAVGQSKSTERDFQNLW